MIDARSGFFQSTAQSTTSLVATVLLQDQKTTFPGTEALTKGMPMACIICISSGVMSASRAGTAPSASSSSTAAPFASFLCRERLRSDSCTDRACSHQRTVFMSSSAVAPVPCQQHLW